MLKKTTTKWPCTSLKIQARTTPNWPCTPLAQEKQEIREADDVEQE